MSNEHAAEKPHPKEVTVTFNGRPKTIAKDWLTFDEVVVYSFDNPPSGDGVQFTIQYTRPQRQAQRHPAGRPIGQGKGWHGVRCHTD